MLMFANPAMIRSRVAFIITMVVFMPALALSQPHADSTGLPQLTWDEYEGLVGRLLRCPSPELRETRDFQLCLLIIPPGHRMDERELLTVVRSRMGEVDITLVQPERPLWHAATEAKAKGDRELESLAEVRIRRANVSNPNMVRAMLGRSLFQLSTTVVPRGDWFMDATRYRFQGQSHTGTTLLELTGPGRTARRQPSGTLAWAEHLRGHAENHLRGIE